MGTTNTIGSNKTLAGCILLFLSGAYHRGRLLIKISGGGLDVKPEVNNVTIFNNVVFAL